MFRSSFLEKYFNKATLNHNIEVPWKGKGNKYEATAYTWQQRKLFYEPFGDLSAHMLEVAKWFSLFIFMLKLVNLQS